ncbi:hypothetical protein NC653_014888 [Populus alba x Populus x berolinensis]|uniref:Uncharacterized protein n=1 Tax=Populus alba x Populus x berolinensis TaxID=444605 RepID=A0AAD6W4B8_9ROSI|nr:hypothetical protein NC653_014888 [Populus alba x Populus x berolinensis]
MDLPAQSAYRTSNWGKWFAACRGAATHFIHAVLVSELKNTVTAQGRRRQQHHSRGYQKCLADEKDPDL